MSFRRRRNIERGRPSDPAKSVYLESTAITRGKPAITTESGGMGLIDHLQWEPGHCKPRLAFVDRGTEG